MTTPNVADTDDIYIRRASNADSKAIHAIVKEAYQALVVPIFKTGLRKGLFDVHFKGLALSVGVAAYANHMNTPILQIIGLCVAAYIIVPLLLLVYIWMQMRVEAAKHVEGDLLDIEKHYGAKGHYMWVVCKGKETNAAAGDALEEEEDTEDDDADEAAMTANVIACAGFTKNATGTEGQLWHLVVTPSERGKKIGATLLKHVLKHAKAQGVARIVALTSSAQEAARHVLKSAGYQDKTTTRVSPWFSAHKMELRL